LIAAIVCLVGSVPVWGEEPSGQSKSLSEGGRGIDAIKPFFKLGTGAVAHIDLEAANRKELGAALGNGVAVQGVEAELRRQRWVRWLDELRDAGATDLYVFFWLSPIGTRTPQIVIPAGAPGFDAEKIKRLFDRDSLGADHPIFAILKFLGDDECRSFPLGVVVGGSKIEIKNAKDSAEVDRWLQPIPRPDLVTALQRPKSSPVQLVLGPGEGLREYAREALGRLPIKVTDGTWAALLDDLAWVGIGMQHDLTLPGPEVSVIVEAKTADGALRLQKQLELIAQGWASYGGAFGDPDAASKWLSQLAPAVEGNRLVLQIAAESEKMAAVQNVLQGAQRAAMEDSRCVMQKMRLAKIGLAMHEYLDHHKRFPSRIAVDKGGRPLLSWRVSLLPYLGDETATLYRRFRLDEPWDSPHNRELIKAIPRAYCCGKENLDTAGKTVFVVPVGAETMFAVKPGPHPKDVADGLQQTIMAVETDDDNSVFWTKPEDLPYQPERPLAGLAVHWLLGNRTVQVLMADGAKIAIAVDEPVATLRAFFTRAGGEPPSR